MSWHRRNEEKQKKIYCDTHTHTHSDPTGIQTTNLINMTQGNWRGNAFNKELRKIAKGAIVIQSRFKLGTSLIKGGGIVQVFEPRWGQDMFPSP